MQEMTLRSQYEGQQNLHKEGQQFQSISSHEDEERETEEILQQRGYLIRPIQFPQPELHSLRLYQIYQQNSSLILELKQQINNLQKTKQQNLYLNYDTPKLNFQQQQSQFFLRSQQIYQERQEQLHLLRQEINLIDNEQMKTLMSKNHTIYQLTHQYFKHYRTIIDIHLNGELILAMTKENIIKNKKRKHSSEHATNNRSSSQSHSTESINNKNNLIKPNEKHTNSHKNNYNIRILPLTNIFEELSEQNITQQTHHYTLALSPHNIPISCSYDDTHKSVIVLFDNNTISCYRLPVHQQQRDDQQSLSSHKSHKSHSPDNKLIEISTAKIQLDPEGKVIFCQLKNNSLFLLTSDGILRHYITVIDQYKLLTSFCLKNILYCLNSTTELSEIQGMCLSPHNSDELLFTTTKNQVCKVSLTKYKSQLLYELGEKIVSINPTYIETETNFYLNYLTFSGQKTKISPIQKSSLQVFQMTTEERKDLLQVIHTKKQKTTFFVRVSKHGLMTGFKKEF